MDYYPSIKCTAGTEGSGGFRYISGSDLSKLGIVLASGSSNLALADRVSSAFFVNRAREKHIPDTRLDRIKEIEARQAV
jgi:hypothetical protein